MSTKNIAPNTTTQTSGGKFQTFKDLKNIKTVNDKFAVTELVHGKTKPLNRPATVTVSNFKASLPTGSLVTKIQVKYKHEKVAYNNKVCNIPAPTISLMNGKKVMKKALSKRGEAPIVKTSNNKITENTVTFTKDWSYTDINNKDFGVRIDYPTNTNDDEGYLRLYYIKVIVTYKTPSYGLGIYKLGGGVNGKEYTLNISCSNKNGVTYSPPIVITCPPGFTLKKHAELGKLVAHDARTFTWTPNFGKKVSNDELLLMFDTNVTFPSGSDSYRGTFEVQETLTEQYKSHTAVITKDTAVTSEGESGSEQQTVSDDQANPNTQEILFVDINEEFSLDLTFPDYERSAIEIYPCLITNQGFGGDFNNFSKTNLTQNIGIWDTDYNNFRPMQGSVSTLVSGDFGLYQNKFRISKYGEYVIAIYDDSWRTCLKQVNICVKPSALSHTFVRILSLHEEELKRLGHNIPYIAQTYMKLSSNESYVRDWGKNFRIGVFNNKLQDTSQLIQIVESARVSQFTATFTINPDIVDELEFDSINVKSDVELDTTMLPANRVEVSPQYEVKSVNVTVELLNEANEVLTSCDALIDFDNQSVKLFADNYYDGNIDYSALNSKNIFENAEYWSSSLKTLNTFENLECNFTYNKRYPVYILLTGDYIEGRPNNNNISFSEPCVIENDKHYNGWESNGTFPICIDDLVKNDTNSELTMPGLEPTNRVILYDLPLENDYGTNTDIAVRGIEIRGNIEKSDDDIVLRFKLRNSKNESKERSIVLNAHDTNLDSDSIFSIGGMGDLWGFSTLDIVNLEDWQVEIQPDNTLNSSDSYLNLGNLEMVIYVQNIEHQPYKCYIEGEDLSYYGVFVNDVDIPEGLETDTRFLKIDGTDTNEPYSQNITEKTITVEFDIGDACDLEGNTLSLRELTRLLVNKRDEYHHPIPKRIEFDHYPDVYWEYILEKTLDSELEINTYNAKFKLTIPAGTAFAKSKIITNNSGYVSGIAAINPVIIFKPVAGADTIQINEEESQQSFNMGYTGWDGKYVELDCENQKATLLENDDDETGKDISGFVDWTSDWFRLIEEYRFTSVNCNIHSIAYQERW